MEAELERYGRELRHLPLNAPQGPRRRPSREVWGWGAASPLGGLRGSSSWSTPRTSPSQGQRLDRPAAMVGAPRLAPPWEGPPSRATSAARRQRTPRSPTASQVARGAAWGRQCRRQRRPKAHVGHQTVGGQPVINCPIPSAMATMRATGLTLDTKEPTQGLRLRLPSASSKESHSKCDRRELTGAN